LALKIPDPAKIPEAEQYVQWYKSGEHDKIPHKGMEFITAVYEAQKTLTLAKAGGKKSVWVSAASIGEVAFAGIPGEGFCEIGQQIRSNSPFAAQFTLGLTNGSEGYFPMKDAFEVNGYESRTSSFQPRVGEALAAASDALIRELYNIDHKE